MSITTKPASRFAWPGNVVEYDVHVSDADELVLADDPAGLDCAIVSRRRSGGGIDAVIQVRVRDDASMD